MWVLIKEVLGRSSSLIWAPLLEDEPTYLISSLDLALEWSAGLWWRETLDLNGENANLLEITWVPAIPVIKSPFQQVVLFSAGSLYFWLVTLSTEQVYGSESEPPWNPGFRCYTLMAAYFRSTRPAPCADFQSTTEDLAPRKKEPATIKRKLSVRFQWFEHHCFQTLWELQPKGKYTNIGWKDSRCSKTSSSKNDADLIGVNGINAVDYAGSESEMTGKANAPADPPPSIFKQRLPNQVPPKITSLNGRSGMS